MDKVCKKVIIASYIVTGISLSIFVWLRNCEYTYFKEISTEEYVIDEGAKICIEGLTDSDYIIISGYAYWEDCEYKNFSCDIALRDVKTNRYYKIPTQAVSRPDLLKENLNFDKTGFYARVSKRKGEFGEHLYEICYLAENNGNFYLVHTKEYMGTE